MFIRKNIVIFLLVFFLVINVTRGNLLDDLNAYYDMDDSTNMEDSTGLHVAGILNGDPIDGVGVVNGGVEFDGTDDYYALGWDEIGTSQTWAAWIYPTAVDTGGNSRAVSTIGAYAELTYDAGNYKCGVYDGGQKWATSTTAVVLNSWAYIVCIWNSTDTTVHIYVNGSHEASTASNAPSVQAAWSIGGAFDNTQAMIGNIDEVGFWNRTMNQSEVTQLFNSGVGLGYPFSATTTISALIVPDNPIITDTLNGYCNATHTTPTQPIWYFYNWYLNDNLLKPGLDMSFTGGNGSVVNSSSSGVVDIGYAYDGDIGTAAVFSDIGDRGSFYFEKPVKTRILTDTNISMRIKVIGDSAKIYCLLDDGTYTDYVVGYIPVMGEADYIFELSEAYHECFNYSKDVMGLSVYQDAPGSIHIYELYGIVMANSTSNTYKLVDKIELNEIGNYTFECMATDMITNGSWVNSSEVIAQLGHMSFSGYDDNSSAIFPEVNDTIALRINVADADTVDTCLLATNDSVDGLFYNVSEWAGGLTLMRYDKPYLITTNSTYNRSTVGWMLWCNDTLGNVNISDVQYFDVVDLTSPAIQVAENNSFSFLNTTAISNMFDLNINMLYYDVNLEYIFLNVTCEDNGTIFTGETDNINETIEIVDETVDLEGMSFQRCEVLTSSRDNDYNWYNTSFLFYIGGQVNISTRNLYDNYTINNVSFYVSSISGTPTYNPSIIHTFDVAYTLYNISNGTHTLYFSTIDNHYFNMSYVIDVNESTILQNYTSYQGIVYVKMKNVVTLDYIPDLNTTMENNNTAKYIYQTPTDNSTTNTFYMNSSNYTLYINQLLYYPYEYFFFLDYYQTLVIDDFLSFPGDFNIFDEKTLDPFNVTFNGTGGLQNMSIVLYCPNEWVIYYITANSFSLPVNCTYSKFDIKQYYDYGQQFYRTFILAPDNLSNTSIYLIDFLTTQSILTTFNVEDPISSYYDKSLYIKKIIGVNTHQIFADFFYNASTLQAYLISNDRYFLEVHSSNKPIFVVGEYISAVSGTYTIRLYEISLDGGKVGFFNNVYNGFGSTNVTSIDGTRNDTYAYMFYNDTESMTDNVTFYLWRNSYNGTLITAPYSVNGSSIYYTYNISSEANNSIYGEMVVWRNGERLSFSGIIRIDNTIRPAAFDWISQGFIDWFIMILITVIALQATIRTSNLLSLGVSMLALLLNAFHWYSLSRPIIGLALLLSLIMLFRKSEKEMVS